MTQEKWLEITGGDLARDRTLVEPGDLVETDMLNGPGGSIQRRQRVAVARVVFQGQIGLQGRWWAQETEPDGTPEGEPYQYWGTFYLACFDPIRVLRGGAPEIFDGQGVPAVRARLADYAAGAASFPDVIETVGAAVFPVGQRPARNQLETYQFAEELRMTNRDTVDMVFAHAVLLKQITHAEMFALREHVQYTTGDVGPLHHAR